MKIQKTQYERSCGAIVFRFCGGKLQVLMVRHAVGHWSFPKGHVENQELDHETAIREVREETGVDIEITCDFHEESTYSPCPGISKTVTFFIGDFIGGSPDPQLEEVSDAQWLTPEEAEELLIFDRDLEIFHDALRYIGFSETPETPGAAPDDIFTLKRHYSVGELPRIMAFLRSEKGCPWDRVQTHESIAGNFLEEAYEAVDAIARGDADNLLEELGDVLMQVVFHARISEEKGRFDFGDVVSGICRKLISRHSHIFGNDRAATPEEVLSIWNMNKEKEKGQQSTSEALSGVSRSMPALTRAHKLQKRAARVGFDWPDATGALGKVREELGEFSDALGSGTADAEGRSTEKAAFEEAGDLLFAVVNVLRLSGIDAESALSAASEKFVRRFSSVEKSAEARGKSLETITPDEMDELWNEAKVKERAGIKHAAGTF